MNRLLKCSVFAEKHESGESHYHFPILADEPWGWAPLARELRNLSIHVGFSVSHSYYWTSFIYLCVPDASPGGKSVEALDANPWLSPGHPCVRETLEDIPRGARAADKSRVRRYLCVTDDSRETGKNMSLTDQEFAAHVVRLGLRTRQAVLAWVASRSGPAGKPCQTLAVEERSLLVPVFPSSVLYSKYGVRKDRCIVLCLHFTSF